MATRLQLAELSSMRTIMPVRFSIPRPAHRSAIATLLALALPAGVIPLAAQQSPTPPSAVHQPSAARRKAVHAHQKTSSHAQPVSAQVSPATPPAPKLPDWPANDRPSAANITWNSQGLRIEASNSSLRQILSDVSTATGAKIEGLSADQRIFGAFGPGKAHDVLSQLLDGSGYNVLMIGDQGQGTPREVLLTPQVQSAAQPAPQNPSSPSADDDSDNGDQAPPEDSAPPAVRNGFNPPNQPGMPPRTPQQIMQEMQQHQQQVEQIQEQQNAPQ